MGSSHRLQEAFQTDRLGPTNGGAARLPYKIRQAGLHHGDVSVLRQNRLHLCALIPGIAIAEAELGNGEQVWKRLSQHKSRVQTMLGLNTRSFWLSSISSASPLVRGSAAECPDLPLRR
ncbi:MAG: hypothetical protein U0176_03180 [Bacteroidia bacterium]